MNTYAVVDPAGIVINIIVADLDFEIPGMSLVEASEGAAIGGSYADGAFTPPEPVPAPVPDRVTARQFKLQLLAAGLLDQVEAWIASQSQAVQIAYNNSGTFVRNEPMMQAGFAALDFTSQQIDAFFTAAAAL
jgi:hypothetical protein